MYGESPVLCTGVHVNLLGDDQCVDVMNKKLIIDVFGVPHLFLSCCTEILVKGAACQSESYDSLYLRGKEEFWTFRLSGALRDTHMFNTMSVLDVSTSFFMSF